MKSYKVKGKTDLVLVTARVRTRELKFKSRPHPLTSYVVLGSSKPAYQGSPKTP